MAISSRCFTLHGGLRPCDGWLSRAEPSCYDGRPVRRDKDAVFKHKRVAETKGRSAICGPPGIHQQRMPLASLTNLSRRMSTISKQAIQLRAEVPFDLGGQRLDQVAAQLFSEHSRSRLAAWIKDGLLTVDGAVLRPATPCMPVRCSS